MVEQMINNKNMDEVRTCKHHGESIYRYYESQNK